jgi:ubiquinone/menaquinone biosynthesis C-methylase UbiE
MLAKESDVPVKGYKGLGMEGGVARWYAKITGKDAAELESLARRMASNLSEGARVLEVAPGPGYFAIALAKLGKFQITGLDISKTFVEIAQRNAKDAGVTIDFRHGNASAMRFDENVFDLIFCRAAFKNFTEPVKALAEMRRVLAPGGRAVIIDLRRDASVEEIDTYIEHADLGALNALITKWTFRHMLLKRAYTRPEFERFIAESGWQNPRIDDAPIGFEITLTK